MKADTTFFSNSEIRKLVDEYSHELKYRELLKDRLCDGLSFCELANKYHIGERQLQKIIDSGGDKLLLEIYPVLKQQGKI